MIYFIIYHCFGLISFLWVRFVSLIFIKQTSKNAKFWHKDDLHIIPTYILLWPAIFILHALEAGDE